MSESWSIQPVAHMRSDFPEKFGIPRQSGLVQQLRSRVVFAPEFRDVNALRGLEAFSHLWLIWGFSGAVDGGWSPTVRPPRLGGDARMGVFATRSPFRPNHLGLSCVRLVQVHLHTPDGPVLEVAGADLMDGTPIFDIKPYVPYADSRPEASGGFTTQNRDYTLQVNLPEHLRRQLPPETAQALEGVLAQDPRPPYQKDPARSYGLSFAGWQVHFHVADGVLTVDALEKLP